MKVSAARMKPGDDLKRSLIAIVEKENIGAGCVLSCVGSLAVVNLRLSDESLRVFEGNHEIVSLNGTLCRDDVHLHLAVADKFGNVYGGHLKEGCVVLTTVELVYAKFSNMGFTREYDSQTGFKELKIAYF